MARITKHGGPSNIPRAMRAILDRRERRTSDLHIVVGGGSVPDIRADRDVQVEVEPEVPSVEVEAPPMPPRSEVRSRQRGRRTRAE